MIKNETMNFQEFTKTVKESLTEMLPYADVQIHETLKNNGLVRYGISAKRKDINNDISPIVYLEDFFKEYEKHGMSLSEILNKLVAIMSESKDDLPVDYEFIQNILSFEFVKDRIIFTVYNADRNTEFLKTIPHQKQEGLDLVMIYKIMLPAQDGPTSSVTIDHNLMQKWGVDKETIHKHARKNTPMLLPLKVKTMGEVIGNLLGESIPELEQIYIISNSMGLFGVATVFYDNVLAHLSEVIGEDLCILPSSIHEVIVMGKHTTNHTHEGLFDMVKCVNKNAVLPEEQLSDNVYIYSKEEKTLSILK